jgi:hypothetical protein
MSPEQEQAAREIKPSVVCFDSTGQVNQYGYPLFALVVPDEYGMAAPSIAVFILATPHFTFQRNMYKTACIPATKFIGQGILVVMIRSILDKYKISLTQPSFFKNHVRQWRANR